MLDDRDPRAAPLLDCLAQLALGDYSIRFPISEQHDLIDTIGYSLNVMAEELEATLAAHEQAEATLRESEERYRVLFKNAVLPIIQLGIDGSVLDINDVAAQQLGVSAAATIGCALIDLLPELRQRFPERVRQILKSGAGATYVDELATSQGPRWFRSFVHPIRDATGQITSLQLIAHDITEQRLSERRIRQLSEAIELGPAAVIITDLCGRIEQVNRRFTEITGYDAEELLGQTLEILAPDVASSPTLAEIALALDQHRVWQADLLRKRKGGETYWQRTLIAAVSGSDGEPPTHHVWIAVDVTAQKQHEEALRVARRQAEAGNRAKSIFFANVSHELRTPLNAVIGFADLLENPQFGPLNAEQRDFVSEIAKGGNHLLSLINDIIDLAAIESGRLTLQLLPTSVSDLVVDTVSMLRPLAHKAGVSVTVEGDYSELEAFVDPRRLTQILHNLVSNAIKFTAAGGSVQVLTERDGHQLMLRVQDTGVGIAADDLPKIFQSFSRLDRTQSGPAGSGLGLALVRSLCELHGGSVSVVSEEGRGSTFTVVLPLVTGEPSGSDDPTT